MKLGVISASNVSKVVAKKGSQGRMTYMTELIGQVCTGLMKDISAATMDWGNHHEDGARASYEIGKKAKLIELPFVFKDDTFREGCSPDALIVGKDKGVEIKCPYDTANHIKFLLMDKIKSEYTWQMQYTMRCLDADFYDFCSYDPRMKKKLLKICETEKDEEKQKTLADAIPQFIKEFDDNLKLLGFEFGDQWGGLNSEKIN